MSAWTRWRTAGSSPSAATSSPCTRPPRGGILDVYPATEERAVRCELFDVEVERLTFFSTFTQRSLEEAEVVEIAPAAEIGPEYRESAEIAALETDAEQRPDIADVLPVDRFCDFM